MATSLPNPDPTATRIRARIVRFRLRDREYALPLSAVAGLTEPRPIRSVAGSPDVVLGITEWRGQLLTVIDLPAILEDGPGTGPACLVRLAEPFESTALFVPAAVRLQRIGTPIAPVTSGNGTTGSRGTIDLDGRRLVVLAAAPLMAAVEES